MKMVIRGLQALYSLYAGLLFIVLMFIVLPFAVVASFFGTIRSVSFVYRLCILWSDAWLLLIGIIPRHIYITPHNKDHACIFVANHTSYMDIPMLVNSIRQPIRILGKVETSSIPLFGFLYRQATVMVDRSSMENRAKSVMRLKAILKKRISIVIFPEGTFNMTASPLKEFYNGAFRIAIETQTAIKPVIFPDTLGRMHYASFFLMTPGISRAVFLEEISVRGLTLQDVHHLKDKVYNMMDVELRKWRKYEEISEFSSGLED
ncbi:MAG: lysophospholipid acyltransferase family protein [Chitinophagaceae bacterium]